MANMARVPASDFMYPILQAEAVGDASGMAPIRTEAAITLSKVTPVREIEEFNRVLPICAEQANRLISQQIADHLQLLNMPRSASNAGLDGLFQADAGLSRAEKKRMRDNLRLAQHMAWLTQLCTLRLNHFLAHDDLKVPGFASQPSYHPFLENLARSEDEEESDTMNESREGRRGSVSSSEATTGGSTPKPNEQSGSENADNSRKRLKPPPGTIPPQGLFSGTTKSISALSGSLVPGNYPDLTHGFTSDTNSAGLSGQDQDRKTIFQGQKPTFTGVGPYALPLPISLRGDRVLFGTQTASTQQRPGEMTRQHPSFSTPGPSTDANSENSDPSFRPPAPDRMVATPLFDDITKCEQALLTTRRRLQKAESLIQQERAKLGDNMNNLSSLSSPSSTVPAYIRANSAPMMTPSGAVVSTPTGSTGSGRTADRLAMANAALHQAKKELDAVTKILTDHFVLLFTTPSHPLGLAVCTYVAWVRRRAAHVYSGDIDLSLAAYSPFSAYQHHHQLQQQIMACGNNPAAVARVHRRHARNLATYILSQYQQYYAAKFFGQALQSAKAIQSVVPANATPVRTSPSSNESNTGKADKSGAPAAIEAAGTQGQADTSSAAAAATIGNDGVGAGGAQSGGDDTFNGSQGASTASQQPVRSETSGSSQTGATQGSPLGKNSVRSPAVETSVRVRPLPLPLPLVSNNQPERTGTQPVPSPIARSPSLTSQRFFASTPPTNAAVSVFSLVAAGTPVTSSPRVPSRDQSTHPVGSHIKTSSSLSVGQSLAMAGATSSEPSSSFTEPIAEQTPSAPSPQRSPLPPQPKFQQPQPSPPAQSTSQSALLTSMMQMHTPTKPIIHQEAFAAPPRDPGVPFSYSDLLTSQVLSVPLGQASSPALSSVSASSGNLPPPLQLTASGQASSSGPSLASPTNDGATPEQPQFFFGPASTPYITTLLAPEVPVKRMLEPAELQVELEALLSFIEAHWQAVLLIYPKLSECPECAELGKRVLSDVVISALLDCLFVVYKLACCEDDAAVLRACKALATKSLSDFDVPPLFRLGDRFPGRHAKRVHKLWMEFTAPPPQALLDALSASNGSQVSSVAPASHTAPTNGTDVRSSASESGGTASNGGSLAPAGSINSQPTAIREFVVPPPPAAAIDALTEALAALPKVPIAPYYRAVMKLRLIPFLPSIRERLDCLASVFNSLDDSVAKYYARRKHLNDGTIPSSDKLLMCADDVISVLAFCIVQAQVPCLVTVYQMLMDLLDPALLNGPKGYGLATLATSISVVLSLEAQFNKKDAKKSDPAPSKASTDSSVTAEQDSGDNAPTTRLSGSYESTDSTAVSMTASTWTGGHRSAESIAGSAEIGSVNFRWGQGQVTMEPFRPDADFATSTPSDWSRVMTAKGFGLSQPNSGGGGLKAALEQRNASKHTKSSHSTRPRAPSDASDLSDQTEMLDEVSSLLPSQRNGARYGGIDGSMLRREAQKRTRALFGLENDESLLYDEDDPEKVDASLTRLAKSVRTDAALPKVLNKAVDLEEGKELSIARPSVMSPTHARTTSEMGIMMRRPSMSSVELQNAEEQDDDARLNSTSLHPSASMDLSTLHDPCALDVYHSSTSNSTFALGSLFGFSKPISLWPTNVSKPFFIREAEHSVSLLLRYAGLTPAGYGLPIGAQGSVRWELHSDKDNIRTYTHNVPGSPTPIVKATAVFAVNPAILFAILRSPKSRALLDPYCESSESFARDEVLKAIAQVRASLSSSGDPELPPLLPSPKQRPDSKLSADVAGVNLLKPDGVIGDASPEAQHDVVRATDMPGFENISAECLSLVHHKFAVRHWLNKSVRDATVIQTGVALPSKAFAVASRSFEHASKKAQDPTLRVNFLTNGFVIQPWKPTVPMAASTSTSSMSASNLLASASKSVTTPTSRLRSPSEVLGSGNGARPKVTESGGVDPGPESLLGSAFAPSDAKHIRTQSLQSMGDGVLGSPTGVVPSAAESTQPTDLPTKPGPPVTPVVPRSRSSFAASPFVTPSNLPSSMLRLASPRIEALSQQIQIVQSQIEHIDVALRNIGYVTPPTSSASTGDLGTPTSSITQSAIQRGLATPVAPDLNKLSQKVDVNAGSVYSIVTYIVDVDLNGRGAPWLYEAFTVGQGQALLNGLRQLLIKTKADGWGPLETAVRKHNVQQQVAQLLAKQQTLRNRLRRLEVDYKKQAQAVLDADAEAAAAQAALATAMASAGLSENVPAGDVTTTNNSEEPEEPGAGLAPPE